MVNINSVNFNSYHFTTTANLKTSSNKAAIMVPYKVDMGSDGNIMPFNIFTNCSLAQQWINGWQQKIQPS